MIAALPASAEQPLMESLRRGCGFDGGACSSSAPEVSASGGETERFIENAIDNASGLSGDLLKKTREGEERLIESAINESPTLSKALADADRNRSWRDRYDDRIVDAAVASWSSNMKAGYIKGTAAAYATYKTAPAGINVAAGAALWVGGVVYGLGLGLLASALTGHL